MTEDSTNKSKSPKGRKIGRRQVLIGGLSGAALSATATSVLAQAPSQPARADKRPMLPAAVPQL
jgi:hypothetical protein